MIMKEFNRVPHPTDSSPHSTTPVRHRALARQTNAIAVLLRCQRDRPLPPPYSAASVLRHRQRGRPPPPSNPRLRLPCARAPPRSTTARRAVARPSATPRACRRSRSRCGNSEVPSCPELLVHRGWREIDLRVQLVLRRIKLLAPAMGRPLEISDHGAGSGDLRLGIQELL
jgi:hypothetical protein